VFLFLFVKGQTLPPPDARVSFFSCSPFFLPFPGYRRASLVYSHRKEPFSCCFLRLPRHLCDFPFNSSYRRVPGDNYFHFFLLLRLDTPTAPRPLFLFPVPEYVGKLIATASPPFFLLSFPFFGDKWDHIIVFFFFFFVSSTTRFGFAALPFFFPFCPPPSPIRRKCRRPVSESEGGTTSAFPSLPCGPLPAEQNRMPLVFAFSYGRSRFDRFFVER